jgi:hypothetical protein
MMVMHMFVFGDGFYLVMKSDDIGVKISMARKIDGSLDFAVGAWQGVSLAYDHSIRSVIGQMCTLGPRRGGTPIHHLRNR